VAEIGKDGIMAYEELFIDLLKAEREEDVTDALTVYGLEKFTDAQLDSLRGSREQLRADWSATS
jgi:hypothetical protein